MELMIVSIALVLVSLATPAAVYFIHRASRDHEVRMGERLLLAIEQGILLGSDARPTTLAEKFEGLREAEKAPKAAEPYVDFGPSDEPGHPDSVPLGPMPLSQTGT